MKKLLCIFLAAVMVFSFAACGDKKEEVAQKTDVVVRIDAVLNKLHPFEGISTTANLYVLDQVYEPLVRISDDGEVKPLLAESWDIASDAQSVVFHLHKGVKFHNGEEMKASDVVFSFNTGKKAKALSNSLRYFQSAEVVDDYTVKVTLTQPSMSFINCCEDVMIVSEKFYTDTGDEALNEKTCGTGAYMATEVNLTTEMKLVAFEDYWGGSPAIKNVTVRVITDSTTAGVSLEAGEIDFMQVSNIASYPSLKEDPRFTTDLRTALHTAYILMNNEVAPFDNKLVRQAIAYAVDKDSMVEIAYSGLAVPANLTVDERCDGYDLSGVTLRQRNVEKAKELLAQAGYPNGIDFEKDFNITMDYIGGGFYEKIATVFQQNLADAGMKINLRASETYSNDAKTGNFSIMTQGTTFQYDFAYQSRAYASSSINGAAHSRIRNDRMDELFNLADQCFDDAQRHAYYKEICEIIYEESPVVPIFQRKIPYAWAKDLKAVAHNAAKHPFFIREWSW